MIHSAYMRGEAFSLLGFDAAEPLLPELRLRLDQPHQVRALVRACAEQCERPFYYAKDDLWMIAFDTLDTLVWANAPRWIGPDDIAALHTWFARGKGYPNEDLETVIWFGAMALHGRQPQWSRTGLSEAQTTIIQSFLADVYYAWRDPSYPDLCDAMRDADLSLAELDLADQFNINFYDDVLDPLDVFYSMRVGNILHEMLDKHEPHLPFDEMYRLGQTYIDSDDGNVWTSHGSAEQIDRIVNDIRTIRHPP